MSLQVTVVHACQRAGRGGSPTAVVDETLLSEAERRAVPVAAGTSHAVFISTDHGFSALDVDMGDSLGEPSTIAATTRPGPGGPQVRVGGTATITTAISLVAASR